MKKIITLIFILVAVCAFAQKDVTQFLGIPVDGSKSAMIQKLKAKGFRPNAYDKDVLDGKFNGADVNLFIVTNNNKVCRIMVCDANRVNERSIQIRFNNLCRQFENNPKYVFFRDQSIPDDENISYESVVNKKRYEAVFYQKPEEFSDSALLREKMMPIALKRYTPEEIANPTEEIRADLMNMTYEFLTELCYKKPVWFMITEYCGEYYISMYYDNEYNRANGEDL